MPAFGQKSEIQYHFRSEYHHQFYLIDAANKLMQSKQTITIRNTASKNVESICFLMHPSLTIDSISLANSLEKDIPIDAWQYSGTERIYGIYDVPIVVVMAKVPIKPRQKLFLKIEYTMKPEYIKTEPEKMYEFTVSPKASYAIAPITGNSPFFMKNSATPYTMILKYPVGNSTCVPGNLVSSIKEENYIIDTYEHRRPNVPTFSCAPYKKISRGNDRLQVQYYLYPHEIFSEEMADEMFKVVDLYFNTFGDNGTHIYKFATVGEINSQVMNGENKGSTIFFSDFVARNYSSGPEGKYDYLEFLSHEVFHSWNLFYVYWQGNYEEWFCEGGANFTCVWAAEKIMGDKAATYIKHKLVKRFIDEKGYESSRTLETVRKTGLAERALMYSYGALVWEQLRKKLGDEALFAGLRHLYTKNGFKTVEYSDLLKSFKMYSDCNVKAFLDPWFKKNAMIALSIHDVNTKKENGKFHTNLEIDVETDGINEIFTSIGYRTGKDEEMTEIPIHIKNDKDLHINFSSDKIPVFVQIDPNYIVPVKDCNRMVWKPSKI